MGKIENSVLSNMDRNSKEIYTKIVNDAWPVVKIVVAICRQIVSVTANMFFLRHNSSKLSALKGWWNMYQNVATVPWCQIFLWYQVLGAAIALVWRLSDIWCCWCWGWWCWCYVAWEKVEWFEDRLHVKRLALFFTNSGQTLHACQRSNFFFAPKRVGQIAICVFCPNWFKWAQKGPKWSQMPKNSWIDDLIQIWTTLESWQAVSFHWYIFNPFLCSNLNIS